MKRRSRQRLEPFDDVPILFVSALTKQRIHKALEVAIEVYENRIQRIPTSKLNEVMQEAIEENHPPSVKGKFIRIKYVTQLPTHAPAFAFYCNLPQYVRESYKRYLENKIRKHFSFYRCSHQNIYEKKIGRIFVVNRVCMKLLQSVIWIGLMLLVSCDEITPRFTPMNLW